MERSTNFRAFILRTFREGILAAHGTGLVQSVQWLGYALDDAGLASRYEQDIFSKTSKPAQSPARTLIQLVTTGSTTEAKRLKREADHSPPSGAEVNNEWNCNSTPLIRLPGV